MDINKKNRSDLKSYFVKNSIPTESNFAELIDGMLNQKDDGIVKLSGDPLSIEAAGELAGLQKVINFYAKFQDANPSWSLQLNPRTDPNTPATAKAGFCVADGQSIPRLFIDKTTGNLGVGTITPQARLAVVGAANISNGSGFANGNNYMSNGSLTIGGTNANFGGGNGWSASTAGLLLETLANTEIAVHDAGQRLTSLMYFEGDAVNRITIGRDMAWGVTPVTIANNLTVNGAITPSAGNAETKGIMFPKDAGGGGGDSAWLRYYARAGEAMTLELGTSNDGDDHIAFMPSGNVGIGVNNPFYSLDVSASRGIKLGLEGNGGGQLVLANNKDDNKIYLEAFSKDGAGSAAELLLTGKYAGSAPKISLVADVTNITGNMAIGATIPIAKLDIAQAARSGTHPTAIKGLYITGDFGEADGIEFRHSNATQGIGFGYNTIYAAGSNANQDLQLKPKGTGALHLFGKVDISDGSNTGIVNSMANGSLAIGSITASYGGGNNWNSNTAGLMLQTLANTEIVVHDAGQRLTSLMYFEGDAVNRITIGRDMAWGVTPVTIANNLTVNGAITPSAGNADTKGIMFPRDPGGGGGDAAWLRYYARSGEAMTLELGTSNDADDHIALMSSGNVGIGLIDPKAKLDVAGEFIRKIKMATGIGPTDDTDNGQIVSRVLTFTKYHAETAIRIFYCDNLRVNGSNIAVRWEIRVDGQSAPGGGIFQDKYGSSGNYHEPATILGYAQGISAGAHTIGIWVSPTPGYGIGDACTGWPNGRWTLEVQEVWL
jgi:hypothetical protein